ncbi:MAG: alkaline phosphatase family protein [Clostridia bacterium]|nr:alkaline phosphatase family protein [Clostridia bacterium]
MSKVQLILVDGMRPDSLKACGNPYVEKLLSESLYSMNTRTVMPSVTLPCHMSLFHSVDPTRHGITTNLYMPQVRPINGLCEQLKATKKNGFFYNWEELKDLSRPDSLAVAGFFSGHKFTYEAANQMVTEASIRSMKEYDLDFTFTYLGWVDEAGHGHGWMGEEYLRSVHDSFDCIKKLIESAPEGTITIVVADHGGHDRHHGTEMPEDMTIPVIIHGAGVKGEIDKPTSIKDIAPTIVKILGCECAPEWEGTSIL